MIYETKEAIGEGVFVRFLPGQSGNPTGRMKSAKGGRARALLTLDRMLAKHANQVKLAVELEKDFRENPVRFFKTIIMPLLPHEARVAVEQAGVVEWRSLVSDDILNDCARSQNVDGPGKVGACAGDGTGAVQPVKLRELPCT